MRRAGLTIVLALALAGCTSAPAPTPSPTIAADEPCLVGTWKSIDGEAEKFLENLGSGQFGDLGLDSIDAGGFMIVTFAEDGTFLYQPDLTFTTKWDTGVQMPGTLTGQASGTWTTAPGDILLASADANDVDLTLLLDGVPEPDVPWGWQQLPIAASHYECADDELTLTFTLTFGSYPVRLVPAS